MLTNEQYKRRQLETRTNLLLSIHVHEAAGGVLPDGFLEMDAYNEVKARLNVLEQQGLISAEDGSVRVTMLGRQHVELLTEWNDAGLLKW